jgi:hypothetical protein
LVIIWLAFPIIVPFLISQIPLEKSGIYLTRYTISALPAFLILIASGIDKLLNRKVLFPLFVLILIAISWFSAISIQNYYSQSQKEQWREVVNSIENSLQPGDVIVLNEWYFLKAIEYYSKTDLETQALEPGYEEQEIKQFKANGKQRMWLVQVNWGSKATKNYLDRVSGENSLVYKQQFVGIDVYLLKLNDLPLGTIRN